MTLIEPLKKHRFAMASMARLPVSCINMVSHGRIRCICLQCQRSLHNPRINVWMVVCTPQSWGLHHYSKTGDLVHDIMLNP